MQRKTLSCFSEPWHPLRLCARHVFSDFFLIPKFQMCLARPVLETQNSDLRWLLRTIRPQLRYRPANPENSYGAEDRSEQKRIGRSDERRSGSCDHCAESVCSLSKDRQKTRGPSSHVVRREELYDGSANGDADGITEAESSSGEEPHPKPLRQAE